MRGGEAPVCTACDSHTRERSGCGRSVLRQENPPILPLLFAKKFTFLRHFWTRRWRPELRSCSFGPTLVSICRSVTELAAETRVGSNGQESNSERQFQCWWVNSSRKNKSVKKGAFFGPGSGRPRLCKIRKSRNSNEFGISRARLRLG